MSSIRPRQVQTASRSDVGRVRSVNQDVCDEFENAEGYRLLVVADGMGGHSGGETASRLALENIGRVFRSDFAEPGTLLARAFRVANDEIFRVGASDPALHGMGTTGVAILIGPGEEGWVAHIGDSRAYRLRDGRFEQLTEDHSWVHEETRRGKITADEAREHPMKNVLLRSIGVVPNAEATVTPIDLKLQDCFLLCSDGLWGEVGDRAIAEVLARESPSRAVGELVDLANAHGGSDNVTVQVAALLATEDKSTGAIGTDGLAGLPGASESSARPAPPRSDTRTSAREARRPWTRPSMIAAGLLAAIALFWRVCA
jgi:serine/threonine protein phosphatase PrpC